jgi:PAS domain S-box-containing protein
MNDLVNVSDLIIKTNIVKLKLEQALSYLKDAESGQSGYLLTKDTTFLRPYYGAIEKAQQTIFEVDSLTSENPEQQKNVTTLKILLNDKYDLLNYALRISSDTSLSEVAFQPYIKAGRTKMDDIRTLVSVMIKKEDNLLETKMKEQQRYAVATPFFLTSLSLLSLGILIISFFRIKNDLTDQRNMKAALLIQNETFKHAEESSDQGSYAWNDHTRSLTFSDNFFRLLDASPDSFQTLEQFATFIHPDDRNFVQQTATKAYKGKGSFDIKFRVITKAGIKKYVRATGKNINNPPVNMMVGTLQDITKDTLLNEELRQREQQLKQAHVLGKIGVWEHNFITGEIKWSDELYKIFGYKPGEINISGTYGHDIHKDDLPRLNKAIQKARETGAPFEIEFRRTDKNGQLKYVFSKSEVKKDVHGKVIGLFGVSMDITQLREKEKQLRESELFSTKVVELLPNIIYIFDLDERRDIYLAGNISTLLEYDKENKYDSNDIMNELIDPGYYDKIKIHHANLRNAADNEIHEIEYRFLFKNGKWKYMLSRDMVFKRNHQGEATQIIGVAIDITDLKISNEGLKNLNEVLIAKNAELEQINTELSSFTYIASHDLQEPLRKIRTFSNLITEKEADALPGTTREYFVRITAAATRMQNLIEALLSYSRTNTLETQYEKVDLNKLVEEAKNDLYEIIKEKNVIIESCKLPSLKVIPLQFHQLILNILSNAIKYSKENVSPHIKISAESVNGEDITNIGANEKYKYWKISFADNGIGFEQEYEHKIFELFQRLHGKSQYPGTGIGLAICKKIVLNHNGIIRATGKPGVGSVFTVYIPV